MNIAIAELAKIKDLLEYLTPEGQTAVDDILLAEET